LLASNKSFAFDYWVKWRNEPLLSHTAVMRRMSDEALGMTLELPEDVQQLQLEQIWKTEIRLHDIPVIFIGAGRRANLADEKMIMQDYPVAFIDRRRSYFDNLHEAINSERLSDLGMTGSTRVWLLARAQSVNPYQTAKENRKHEIDTVLSILNKIEPNINPQFMEIDRGRVFLEVRGEKRELRELSSGYAALLKIIQAIVAGYAAFTNEVQLQNVRGFVFIDEIDAHLHAEWQVKIIPCLKKLFPNTTFYVATHSPLVLKQLKEKEAYLLKRDDDDTVLSQVIPHPNRRPFIDVLEGGMDVNLNQLEDDDDQSDLKERMLSLLKAKEEGVV
jgi:hypothetical protein